MQRLRLSLTLALLSIAALSGTAQAADLLYLAPNASLNYASNGTLDSSSYNTTSARSLSFTTGASGPFTVNTMKIGLRNVSASQGSTFTFKIDLRNVASNALARHFMQATLSALLCQAAPAPTST